MRRICDSIMACYLTIAFGVTLLGYAAAVFGIPVALLVGVFRLGSKIGGH